MSPPGWQRTAARIVQGHRVASGQNGNPRFPGGTLRMQAPHFRTLGLDLSPFHNGTLNVSIAPLHFRAVRARHVFRQVRWHPIEPAEDFSFFNVSLVRPGLPPVDGLIYYPHPETKPEHFQSPDVLELLLPWIDGLRYGTEVLLDIPEDQVVIERSISAL